MWKHGTITRAMFVGAWLLCIAGVAGWFVAALHRGYTADICIVGVGLVALVVVPLLRSRADQR